MLIQKFKGFLASIFQEVIEENIDKQNSLYHQLKTEARKEACLLYTSRCV